MAPAWLHCNVCRRTASQLHSRLNITSCGFLFCSSCAAATARRFCRACRGPCRRSLRLDSQAPREVRELFESLATKIKNLHRSAAFQDRQIRNLYSRHAKHRALFKETMMRYDVERNQAQRRERRNQDKLDELERREAFLHGRREHLLLEMDERLARSREKEDEEDPTNMFQSPTTTAKIRRTETSSIFRDRSSFQDSGLSEIMSGDWNTSVRTADNSRDGSSSARERRSPAMQYLLHLSTDQDSIKVDSEPLPVTTFNNKSNSKNKYPFFSSLKRNL